MVEGNPSQRRCRPPGVDMTRPRPFTRSLALLVVPLALVAAACGDDDPSPAPAAPVTEPSAEDTMSESMSDESMSESMSDESMSDESMSESMSDESMSESMTDESMSEADAMAALPAYQTLPITDVDGATFTLHDFAGSPVFVEAFATWCPSCRAQLGVTNEAAATIGDDAVVLALSVETDLAPADVAAYADDNGFDNIRFAVVSPEMLGALVDAFGNSIANPPSTPTFVIDAMGHAGELATGGVEAGDIVAALQSAAG
jgi:thiol-disulfide isomerase/thioredoxin